MSKLSRKGVILCVMVMAVSVFLTACLKEATEGTSNESDMVGNETTREDDMEIIVEMTDEEIEFLCNTGFGEDRIREGKLYSHQWERLQKYRFAKEYLKEKYPEYDFLLYGWTEDSSVSYTETGFSPREFSDGYYRLLIEGENGNYEGKDDFHSYLLKSKYDEMLTELLHEAGIENCVTRTALGGFYGKEIDGDTTVEELLALGPDMKRDTTVYVDMPGEANADTEEVLRIIESTLRDINQYGAHVVYFGEGILDAVGQRDNEFWNDKDNYYKVSINTFDLND